MGSGKVVKLGSKHYKKVETIDIFTMERNQLVEEVNIPDVNPASPSPQPLFVEEEEYEGMEQERKMSEEEPVKAPDTTTIELDELNSLKDEIAKLKSEVKQKDKKIADMKKSNRNEGYQRGQSEGHSKGLANAKNDVEEVLENMKQELSQTLEELKQSSTELMNPIINIIEMSVKKIVGDSYSKDAAEFVLQRIRRTFPDISKLVLRVSSDMFTLFSSIEMEGVSVTMDATMEPKGVFVELEEGVADFSVDTQVQNVVKWLMEEHHA